MSEATRQAYNAAVANGLIVKARQLARVLAAEAAEEREAGIQPLSLARAIHETEPGWIGCGWLFASTLPDGTALCPCPARAEAIVQAIARGVHERLDVPFLVERIDLSGYPDDRKMRGRDPQYPCRLNDGTTVPMHSDWDCIDDMIAEGLVEQLPIPDNAPQRVMYRYRLTPKGWTVAGNLRRERAERALTRA